MVGAAGDEPVEVVDDQGRIVGRVTRREMRARRLLHRSVFVAVLSSDGRLLVQRRSEDKDLWPGWWDVGTGGVLAPGEIPLEGARRELAEELGIEVGELVLVGSGRYTDEHVDELATVYRTVHDGPFSFADGEVTEARFVGRAELDALRPRLVPDSVALLPLDDLLPPG